MGFEPTEHLRVRRFSRPDPSTARTSLHIDFSIIWTFLEFLLDMLFLNHRGVCEKPDPIRVFGALASEMLTTFQDRLVMTASTPLCTGLLYHVFAGKSIIFSGFFQNVAPARVLCLPTTIAAEHPYFAAIIPFSDPVGPPEVFSSSRRSRKGYCTSMVSLISVPLSVFLPSME